MNYCHYSHIFRNHIPKCALWFPLLKQNNLCVRDKNMSEGKLCISRVTYSLCAKPKVSRRSQHFALQWTDSWLHAFLLSLLVLNPADALRYTGSN